MAVLLSTWARPLFSPRFVADELGVWRVQSIVERMGHNLTEAAGMLQAVLQAMDAEMTHLQRRLELDASALRAVVERADVPDADRAFLLEATARIERTAHQVATFAHRPPDADAQIDALLAEPIPPPEDLR